jgi:hypothetical protein
LKPVNIEHLIDAAMPEAMNYCPVCDYPVQESQDQVLVSAWGMATLAHGPCVPASFITDISYESAAYQRGVAAAVDDVKRYAVKGRKRDE